MKIIRPSLEVHNDGTRILHCINGHDLPPEIYEDEPSGYNLSWLCLFDKEHDYFGCGRIYRNVDLTKEWFEYEWDDKEHWHNKKIKRIRKKHAIV